MKKIFIIGYYDHANSGDEQYKNTFSYLINNILDIQQKEEYKIVFIDCDKLKNYNKEENIDNEDIIIVGGGDVLNNYFLDKILNVFHDKSNKIYAISVGIPYINVLMSGKLNIFTSIYIRSLQDLDTLKEYHHDVHYIPDISCLIKKLEHFKEVDTEDNNDNNKWSINMNELTNDGKSIYNKLRAIKRQKVCLSLTRHIYNKNYPDYYSKLISKLSSFIKHIILNNYHVILLPFNTNISNSFENDIIIHNDIMQELTCVGSGCILTDRYTKHITNITYKCNEYDIYKIYKTCHIIIPMRFHSCLYSIYTHVPFLPVYTTRKINNLLLDYSWNYGYKLTTNSDDVPIDLNLEVLILRFNTLISEYSDCIKKLSDINLDINILSNNYNLIKIESEDNKSITKEMNLNPAQILIKSNTTADKIEYIINKVNEYVQEITGTEGITKGSIMIYISNLFNIKDTKIKNIIVQMVSYYLTNGNTHSVYNYGLYEKMFQKDYNIFNEWLWILEDYNKSPKNSLKSNPSGLFNINYIDQYDYSGVHRSGWHYVYENIAFLHNESSTLFLDLYLDRTFHWNNDINKILGIIPYKTSWCGFIHHTFDTEFSQYNCVELFKNINFIESLQYCKGIFVLSEILRNNIEVELKKLSHLSYLPQVYSFIHPTETEVLQFNTYNFIHNKDKKLIHIGGWLRHIYNFYNLNIQDTIEISKASNIYEKIILNKKGLDSIKKVALRGKNMNNYFPNTSLLQNIHSILLNYQNDIINHNESDETNSNANSNISTNTNSNANSNISTNGNLDNIVNTENDILNNWHKHFYKDINNKLNSVHIIEYMDNDLYDKLLSENIVFLNLVDASAVNTLIECIVRNTPIIINKLPAVIELLGSKYPLYYNNIDEVSNLINEKNIMKAYKYITNINKKKFTITYFISNFINNIHHIHGNLANI